MTLTGLVLLGAALTASQAGFSTGEVRTAVGDGGVTAMLGFVAVYAALTVAMFPGSVMSLAAGAVFGAAVGTALTVGGATLGATLAFLIGRRLSRSSILALAGERFRRIDGRLTERGAAAMLGLRLIPLVPFNVLNYAAGATSLTTRHYLVGTVLGILPGSFAFASAGATASEPSSPTFFAALALLGALIAIGAIGARHRSRTDAAAP